MEETIFSHIDHTALSEKVYIVLRTKILKRELKFGQKLLIDDIAHQLGVSRTPVKDAANRLALEGLVEKVPRRGRVELLLAEMEKCMANLDRVANGDHLDREAWMSWNRDLHLSLIRLADNSHLLQTYEGLNIDLRLAQVLLYSRGVEYLVQTQQEHRAIYEALKNGSWQQVKEAISTHINTTKMEALKALEAQVGTLVHQ